VEGIRSAAEALAARAQISFAVVSPRAAELAEGEALCSRLVEAGMDVTTVSDAELASFSDAESSQGVLLVCAEPAHQLERLDTMGGGKPPAAAGLRLLVMDGLQDPGNVGTLVRGAAAFGLSGVIALEGTADLYSPKAVRASAGGVFRVPLLRETWDHARRWMAERHVQLLVADAAGVDATRVKMAAPWALAIGNEARGVRPEVSAASQLRVGIPMPGGSESLNAAVAGSILLYVITREPPPQGEEQVGP
jgi:TrmH family RNA methyltransferase